MTHWEVLIAGVAILAGLWSQAKRMVAWLSGLLMITVRLDTSLAEEHVRRVPSGELYV
jgi:hypothetical protein